MWPLLFFLSLIPFFTEWMAQTRLSAFPTAVYAGIMLVSGAAFSVLNRVVGRQSVAESEMVLLERAARRKNIIAMSIYAIAIPAAYYHASISLALIFLVALLYAIPSLWLDRCTDQLEAKDAHRTQTGDLSAHDLSGHPLSGPDLSGRDLSGRNLSGQD